MDNYETYRRLLDQVRAEMGNDFAADLDDAVSEYSSECAAEAVQYATGG